METVPKAASSASASLKHWLGRHWPALTVGLLGLAITLVVFGLIRADRLGDRRSQFEREAGQRLQMLQNRLYHHLGDLAALRRFMISGGEVDRRAFNRFAGGFVEKHCTQAMEWAPRVRFSERRAFERAARRSGAVGYTITELDPDGRPVPAGDRPAYYPVYFVQPLVGNEAALGFDLGADPDRLAALVRARDTGRPAATGPITLVQETGRQFGFLVLEPVYGAGARPETAAERRAALEGFVLAVFRAGEMVKSICGRGETPFTGLPLALYDLSSPAGKQILYEPPELVDGRLAPDAPQIGRTFDFAGRRWRGVVYGTPAYFGHLPGSYHWLALVGGLVLTALLVLYVQSLFTQRTRAERLAASRTEALGESQKRLAATLYSIGDAVIGCDLDGRVTDMNHMAVRLTGWPLSEAVGTPIDEVFHVVDGRTGGRMESPIKKVLAEGRSVALGNDLALVAKDGSHLQIADSAAPILDAENRIMGAVLVFRDVTESYRMRAELKEREAFQRTLLENLPVGVVLIDSQTRCIEDINPHAASLFGAPAERVVGQQCHQFMCPAQTGQCPILDLGGQVDHAERELVRIDRTTLPILKSVIRVDIGGREKLLECFVDISQRKDAENELRRQSEFLQTMMNTIPIPVFIKDAQSRYIGCNPAFEEFFGFRREDILGLTAADFLPEHEADFFDQSDRELIDGRPESMSYEADITTTDGVTHHSLIHKAAFFDERGDPAGAIGTVLDLTQRIKAEQELRAAGQLLEKMLDGLTDVVSIQKPDHGIVRYNQAGYQALNMTPEEVAGKKCYQLIGRDKPCEECATTMALAQKQVVTIEKYVPELGVHMLCTSNPILDENNRVTLIIEQLRDITEQKEAERELIRTNQRLEQALAFAKDMARQAEAANTAKSEFLANMSHEIRTPMNGVIGMTDLLLQSELDDNQRLYAETVRSSAESLLALINDILDFSKIEAAQLELETIDFQLRPALEDLTDMIALKADQKGLEFICGVHPDVPDRLQGDPGRLRQILTNLCGNAVKFTDRGEVAVQVSVAERLENRVTLRFEVHDTGIGIPTGKIDDLFEAFQQMDASTTRRFGGTGLGLTISKRLVEMMNGEIGVESEEGRGSTFWFTADFVPLAETTARTPRKMIDIQGARMLVVDDNATNRRVLFLMLESWGVRPETASDGPSALDMLRRAAADEDPFLVAVLDMQMPDMDGIQLGEAIKADPEIEETRLVMMTSMSRRGDARRLEEIGFDAYLTKPVKQSQLHDCLAALVSGQPHFQGHPEPQPIITRHVIRESRHANGRVLLVEDNPTNQKVALKILENLGFYADLADNGLEALKALRTASYQLVLMDVQMPEMDGLEAARAIRSGQARVPDPQVPIIALTAHAMKGDREKCLAAGMDDYLPKPFKTQELAEILNRFLGGTESDTSHPSSVTEPESEPSTETTFDYHELVDMLSGDVETAAEMADVFAQDTALHLEGFRLAVESRDVQALKHFCHKIKGSAGMIHARALAETAAEAEVAAAEEDWDRALDLHSRLTDELVRFQDELRKLGLADGQD